MKRFRFRTRLFVILALFAVVPSLVLTLLWEGTVSMGLPLVSGSVAWDSVASSGERAIRAVRSAPLTNEQRRLLAAHELELTTSLTQARRFRYLGGRLVPVLALMAFVELAVLGYFASRVAGHLSRQLSRPLDELVHWTELIGHGETLPNAPPRKGAPEFEVLRGGMRTMAAELERGRARALEAERLRAFRESARQVAHELKNPLTPIRFAVARLRRDAPAELAETVEVLDVESRRLEAMAHSFSQFGKLPEGPAADVDVGELVRYVARSTVPETVSLELRVDAGMPMVLGHHDALARALSNVLINAVHACAELPAGRARIAVGVTQVHEGEGTSVRIAVRDTGCGIPREQLEHIWEPYVTHKAGGTGLGLAIARQTVVAHRGTVEATSEVGVGTEIRLTLPVSGTAQSNGGRSSE